MALKKERLLKQLHLAKSKEMTMMDRIVLLLTVGGFFLVLFLAGQFVWFNWAQESAANHLPADETVLYLELTDLNLQNRIQDKAAESKKILADNLGQIFGVDLSGILSTWGNDHLALAVIKDEYQKNQPLLFVHAKTKSGALKYFRSLLLENEKLMASENENPIYGFERGQPFAFRFTKKYVVIAKSAEALKLLPEE
ncbi:MAG: hypothetical protein OEY44_04350, partial [Candidatus Peregrinibacteria bacterium]|nr:hypothetical protein [Candidatus Peregrinibacteria bacterium]